MKTLRLVPVIVFLVATLVGVLYVFGWWGLLFFAIFVIGGYGKALDLWELRSINRKLQSK